jgi:hypothetical protein
LNQNHFIGVHGSLDYGYRTLLDKNNEYQNLKASRDFFEYPSLGYTLGGSYNYIINKLALIVDAQFSVRGYDENNTGQPQNSTFIPVDYQSFHYYRFIDLGIGLNAYLSKEKLRLFTHVGTKGNIFISGEVRQFNFLNDGSVQETTIDLDANNFNFLSLQINAGIGLEYTQREGLIFRFTPLFNYGLSPISSQLLKEHLFSGSARLTALIQL